MDLSSYDVFFSSRRRHTRYWRDWSSDVCSSDLFARPDESTFRRDMRFDRMAAAMIRAYFFGTGPGTVVPGGLHAFIKTRPELAVPDKIGRASCRERV